MIGIIGAVIEEAEAIKKEYRFLLENLMIKMLFLCNLELGR